MSTPKKIAVAGATGRVGRHVVDILAAEGHEVAEISRSRGVDVITGEGLAEALVGAEAIVDAATGPSPEEQAATEFFTTAARNLQEAGQQAGVERIVVVSIIGSDRFSGGYGAAKVAHEQAMLSGPIPARVLRAAQFHEFVAQLMEWGARGEVTYVPKMRTQLVAARTVAEALADLATASNGRVRRGADPRDRRPARGAPLRDGDAARGPPRRRGAHRGGQRPGRSRLQAVYASGAPAARARGDARGTDLRGMARRGGLRAAHRARSVSPKRSSAPAIHGSASGSSARSASQRCASSRAVEQARRHPEAQRARVVAERLALEHGDVVVLEQQRRELRAGAHAALLQRGAQRLEVGIEVEGARRRAAERAGGGDLLVGRDRDESVQAPAADDVLADLVGLAEDVGGRVLHRSGEARPHLAGHPAQRGRRLGAERPVRQPAEPDPPAAEGHALAQPVGDEDALGQQRGGAEQRLGLVGEVAVDLVADDEQAVLAGDVAHRLDERRGRDRARRVVGEGEDEDRRFVAGRARRAEHLAQGFGVGDAARLLGDRHVEHALAGQRGLRRVAHPRRAGQDDVAREHGEQRVEQRLAAGRDEDAIGARRQSAPLEVPGHRLAHRRGARDRARSRWRRPPRPGARRHWAGPAARPRRRRGAARALRLRSGPARARWWRASGTAAERRATTSAPP